MAVMDRCMTAMGSRLLHRWLHRPVRDVQQLRFRQQAVATFLLQERVGLRESLKQVGDLERILSRIALRSARPRDLSRLRDALNVIPAIHLELLSLDSPRLSAMRANIE